MTEFERQPKWMFIPHTVSVHLWCYDLEPQYFTPASLVLEGIVPRDWRLKAGSKVGIDQVAFNYENGVSVLATRNAITFSHLGEMHVLQGTAQAPILGQKCLNSYANEPWHRTAFSLYGFTYLNEQQPSTISDISLFPKARQARFRGVIPRLKIQAIYRLPTFTMQIEVSDQQAARGQLHIESHVMRDEDDFEHLDTADLPAVAARFGLELGRWVADWQMSIEAVDALAEAATKGGE